MHIRFWVLNLTWYWSYAVSSPGSGLFRKKWEIYRFSSSWNAWLLLTSLKACDWSGHMFGASANPRSFTKILAMFVTLFRCSWRSAWYQICGIRVAIACGIRGWRNLGWYAWTKDRTRVHRTDRTSKQQPCPLGTRPAPWAHVCFLVHFSLFFLFLVCFFTFCPSQSWSFSSVQDTYYHGYVPGIISLQVTYEMVSYTTAC